MSKVVKVIAIVAIAAVIIIAAPYIAAFIAPALGTISAGLTVATITSALVGMGISLGLGALATLFRKVPDMSNALVQRLSTTVDPTAPRKIIFGETAAGADVRFQETHDLPSTKKDGFSQVVALASHRIESIDAWYLDEQLSWHPGGGIQGDYRDAIKLFRPVLEGQNNAGFPIAQTLWNSNQHSFTGCAYYECTFKLDPDVLDQGTPSKRITRVKGCPVYDPRLDSTNGGSGSHRPSDNATWAYFDGSKAIGRNPALCLLTYMLGWRINGKLVWGMGLPVHRINLSSFAFYANLCEEQVAAKGGGTVQRYTCDGAFSTNDAHQTVISGVTAAMGSCILTDTGGVYQLVGGYDDTAEPTISFTADDLIGPTEWRAVPPPRDRFNIVNGRFVDPDQQYQLNEWGEIVTDPLPDGYDRVMRLELGCVSRAETAQRIAKQFLLREAKTPGLFEAVFGPRGFLVEVGSLCTISGHRGWNNKLFRVIKQTEAHDMIYQMTLREESAEVYAWDKDEELPFPSQVRPPAWDPKDVIDPENLHLETSAATTGNAGAVSLLHITWTPEHSGRVRFIQIQTKAIGQDEWTTAVDRYDPKAGSYDTTANIPGVLVQVQARFVMSNGIVGNWVGANIVSENSTSIDGPARDAAEAAHNEAVKAGEDAATAIDAAGAVNKRVSKAVEGIISQAVGLADQGSALARTQNLLSIQEGFLQQQIDQRFDETGAHIRSLDESIKTKLADNTAAWRHAVHTEVTARSAEIREVTQLLAQVANGTAGAIEQEALARADAIDGAIVSLRDTLTASLQGMPGVSIEQKLTAIASAIDGYSASWGIAINNAGAIAGIQLLSGNDFKSEFAVIADRFYLVDPANAFNQDYPFIFEDGILKVKNLKVGNAEIDDLTLGGHKFQANALSQTVEWSWDGFPYGGSPSESSGLSIASLLGTIGTYRTLSPAGAAQITIPLVPDGGKVQITACMSMRQSGGNDDPYRWQIIRDDGYILPSQPFMSAIGQAISQSWIFTDNDLGDGATVNAQNRTYTLQGKRLNDQGGRILLAKLTGQVVKK